jgi:hypothetical protein
MEQARQIASLTLKEAQAAQGRARHAADATRRRAASVVR